MADKRTWGDTYTLLTKGPSCLKGAANVAKWKKCMELPDTATDAERKQCFKDMQDVYKDCTTAYKAYVGSGGKDVPPPPKPPGV
ncbi:MULTISPECIES: hypothetical protein [Roseateles]|uniref:Uncharacterized protein n=1 Tax=Pelomonas caseinilytica TaxID=2906763 RepID=A0ABS8XHP1_9BURK|nr:MULTISPECIES: hypothetical protein [unclassified Roseateles]MCE4540364.1 hypothetical protein [Pelomonas sp. P7]HEV6965181.1 hypothetical protein [Roseateles sp.]